MHEIITLQLGQPSNYLATHFWNAQESYFTYSEDQESPVNHDVHWRPGIGADGSETFMPRTVIYDLKGGFGSLRKINALYDAQDDRPSESALWSGRTVVQRETPIEPADYQRSLEAGDEQRPELTTANVRFWSDFNRVYFHPRSIVQLNEYELNSSLQPFERWRTGEDLFASLDKEHDVLDRDLRPFVEEADSMQGVQVFTTIDDAWGGFAARYAERMRDEYGKSVVWVWGLQDPVAGADRGKRLLRMANRARAMTELYRHASLLVPFSMPARRPVPPRDLYLDTTSRWHTSALLAAAIETVALPSRLKQDGGGSRRDGLEGMADWLNVMGKQTIANLQMDIVDPAADAPKQTAAGPSAADPRQRGAVRRGGSVAEDADREEGVDLPIDLTAQDELGGAYKRQGRGAKTRHIFGQVVSYRRQAAPAGDSDHEDQFVRQQDSGKAAIRRYHSTLLFPQPDSYPHIYRSVPSAEPMRSSVPIVASLTTDSSTEDHLRLLRTNVARSIGLEDRENLSNELAQMAEEYHEGWSSGSDEGDDD